MIKIATALQAIVAENAFLQFGLSRKLLNLAQVARFILPQVKARTKKEVSVSALIMALSRAQGAMKKIGDTKTFKIGRISLEPSLAVLTVQKSIPSHRAASILYTKLEKQSDYCTITEGTEEITVILPGVRVSEAEKMFDTKLLYKRLRVAALIIRFDKAYLSQPGFLFAILQAIAFQNINLVEVASSSTEFILYIDERDTQLAFETIFQTFVGRHAS